MQVKYLRSARISGDGVAYARKCIFLSFFLSFHFSFHHFVLLNAQQRRKSTPIAQSNGGGSPLFRASVVPAGHARHAAGLSNFQCVASQLVVVVSQLCNLQLLQLRIESALRKRFAWIFPHLLYVRIVTWLVCVCVVPPSWFSLGKLAGSRLNATVPSW